MPVCSQRTPGARGLHQGVSEAMGMWAWVHVLREGTNKRGEPGSSPEMQQHLVTKLKGVGQQGRLRT